MPSLEAVGDMGDTVSGGRLGDDSPIRASAFAESRGVAHPNMSSMLKENHCHEVRLAREAIADVLTVLRG
eukprot:CAMPEP_0180792160 /NCGR_PEP_ID=MMETSP1038_2-20121128/54240_1 /TAXON_ID=632150 /ORGANISM="Azadinium spinosum, Strain 3D9" /LENGTH=69 /DNA_ID=CAMNT_0022830439 /DNA_START=69 /DNA_END=274 /DNA_ORIENTATION=+